MRGGEGGMKRDDGSYMVTDDYVKTIERQAETIRLQRIQLDQKDDYIRKLESGFKQVEAGSWEPVEDLPIG